MAPSHVLEAGHVDAPLGEGIDVGGEGDEPGAVVALHLVAVTDVVGEPVHGAGKGLGCRSLPFARRERTWDHRRRRFRLGGRGGRGAVAETSGDDGGQGTRAEGEGGSDEGEHEVQRGEATVRNVRAGAATGRCSGRVPLTSMVRPTGWRVGRTHPSLTRGTRESRVDCRGILDLSR